MEVQSWQNWKWLPYALLLLILVSNISSIEGDLIHKSKDNVIIMNNGVPPRLSLTTTQSQLNVSANNLQWHQFTFPQMKGGNDSECRAVKFVNATEKCSFVRNTPSCQNNQGFINYNEFIFCRFELKLVGLAVFVLAIWWLYLFAALAVTADSFFCPSLVEIAKFLRMSDNIAGVTLLACGNGAPDVFSAIAAVGSMKNGDAGLAIGALFGAGIFVTTVVVGAICVSKPFQAMQRPLLRDIIFYIAAVFFTFYVLYNRRVTLGETIGFLGLYVGYVIVVVVGRYIYRKRKQALVHPVSSPEPVHSNQEVEPEAGVNSTVAHIETDHAVRRLAEVAEQLAVTPALPDAETHQPYKADDNEEGKDDEKTGLIEPEQRSELKQFLFAITPIDLNNWSRLGCVSKGLEIFKAPVVFILQLSIPVVVGGEHLDGWNKPLRLINILIGPVIAVFGARASFALTKIGGIFPVWALVLMISVIVALVVFFTSVSDKKPVYHTAFAFAGFTISLIWISGVANEIVNLLQALGVVMNISNAVLGLTLLAWGNSIADFIADLSMARQGFPKAAISACFGGPLFNSLVGLGVPFAIKIASTGKPIELQFTLIQVVLVTGLFLSLLSSLIVVPLMKFHFKKGYGIYLFAVYAVFLLMVALTETGVITGDI